MHLSLLNFILLEFSLNSRLSEQLWMLVVIFTIVSSFLPFKFHKLPFHAVIKITGKQDWPGREQIVIHWTMEEKINYLDQIIEFSLPTFYSSWISSCTIILEGICWIFYLNQAVCADLPWLANSIILFREKKVHHLLVPTGCHALLDVREVL